MLAVDVAVVVGVALPGDRVAAGPLAVGLRADVERHADAVAGVVSCAAHLRHVPARAEIARPPFPVRLEAAAGEHHRARADLLLRPIGQDADAFDALAAAQQRHRARAVANRDAVLGRCLVFGFDQARAAAVRIDDDTAKKLEPALVLVGLPPVIGQEADAAAHQPVHRVGAATHECLRKIGVDVILCDATEIVEIFLGRIFPEVRIGDVLVAEIGHDPFDVLGAVMHHAEAATGEVGIASTLLLRCAFDDQYPCALLNCRQRGRKRSVAAADHDDIVTVHQLAPG